jgi:hypothetical protein
MIGETPSATGPGEQVPAAGRESPADEAAQDNAQREHGGRAGPEPTRYGDWEKNGRCIDF